MICQVFPGLQSRGINKQIIKLILPNAAHNNRSLRVRQLSRIGSGDIRRKFMNYTGCKYEQTVEVKAPE